MKKIRVLNKAFKSMNFQFHFNDFFEEVRDLGFFDLKNNPQFEDVTAYLQEKANPFPGKKYYWFKKEVLVFYPSNGTRMGCVRQRS